MKLRSVKSKFIGSYAALLFLFLIQTPMIYMLVSSMSEKYAHVDAAGALRKRAVEITEILGRYILTGDEALDKVFHEKMADYDASVGTLRKGSAQMAPISDGDMLAKLDAVEKEWKAMKVTLGKAMENGDRLRTMKKRIEDTTQPMTEKVTSLINAYYGLKDLSYNKNAELAALRRMTSVKLSYLSERYILSDTDRNDVLGEIAGAINFFDDGFSALKNGSPSLGIKPPKGDKVKDALKEVEERWLERKEMILSSVQAKDAFSALYGEVIRTHTPQLVAAANDLTKGISEKARSKASNAIITMVISIFVSIGIAAAFMRSTHGLLSEVTGRMTNSSSALASTSGQMAASSSKISKGASKQSDQTAQVATAMEEMSATVIEVAKNSSRASESAKGAHNTAVSGGEVIRKAIDAMKEVAASTASNAGAIKRLGKSSEKIGTIVSVIDDIADQTNLLALNAAIEAARAGEHGRGFAVVADEVRRLAEKTTKATKEINSMTQAIHEETIAAVSAMTEGAAKAENGVKLAHQAGTSLEDIVKGALHVTEMIAHIATATEQQSTTADEIAKNMETITGVARENERETAEVVKATQEIERHASELKDIVPLL